MNVGRNIIQGRRMQRIQMMMLPLIPAAVLLFQCFFGLVTTVRQRSYVMRYSKNSLVQVEFDSSI